MDLYTELLFFGRNTDKFFNKETSGIHLNEQSMALRAFCVIWSLRWALWSRPFKGLQHTSTQAQQSAVRLCHFVSKLHRAPSKRLWGPLACKRSTTPKSHLKLKAESCLKSLNLTGLLFHSPGGLYFTVCNRVLTWSASLFCLYLYYCIIFIIKRMKRLIKHL